MNDPIARQTAGAPPQHGAAETTTHFLRWHISRILDDTPEAHDGRSIHVVIHHSTAELTRRVARRGVARLRHGGPESRDWWDRDRTVEGTLGESTLIAQFARRPATTVTDLEAEPEERQLAEDMVLLQALPSDSPWEQAVSAYADGEGDLPKLESLATAPGSRWLDLTRPARRAAKKRYRRALRDGARSGQAVGAAPGYLGKGRFRAGE